MNAWHPFRRAGHALALVALPLVMCGCGDADLWARFRAERGMWAVNRDIERIAIQPRLASGRDFERAEAACTGLLSAFPAARWATSERVADPVARGVALEAGRAALALGRIAELRDDPDAALARYETALEGWRELGEVALAAAAARARVLESAGRSDEAASAWERVAASFEPVDRDGRLRDDVLAAPRRAAALARELDDPARARTDLDAGVTMLERWLETERDPHRAAAGWDAVAEALTDAGRAAAARDAWRRALEAAPEGPAAARYRLEMADAAIAAGAPDSAFAILEPVLGVPRLETGLEARLARGRAFAAKGLLDSAIAEWDLVADDAPSAVEQAARARWLRGGALEAAGRWEEARTEYRALTAAYPTHRLGIQAMGRIVEYHAAHGQQELARLEGLRAVDALDRLILGQRDLDVQFEARGLRATLLARVGPAEDAFDALLGLWRRYPRSREGQAAGLRAGVLADSALHDRERAVDLYREMDGKRIRTAVRAEVRARLAALGAQPE